MIQHVGKCPKCGGRTLDYGVSEPQDTQLYYPVDCPDCKWSGREYYNVEFAGFTDDAGNDINWQKWIT